jgi:hypothetical protein
MTKVRTMPVNPERLSRFNEFYSLAFGDYLAARTLLLAELLPQGAGMAATAVEKIFKAILSVRGEQASGHLKGAIVSSIQNYQPALFAQLRPDFLEFLIAAYDLRYLDNLNTGHSLVLSKYRTLAEIDRTMCIVFSGLTIMQGESCSPLPFEIAKAEDNSILLRENYFIEDGSTERYFTRENYVQEIKIFGQYESVNAAYRTHFGNNNGAFTKPVSLEKHETELKGQFSGG